MGYDENPYYTDCMPDYLKYTIEGPTPDLIKRYGGNPDAPIENELTDKDKNSSADEEVEIEDDLTDKIIKKDKVIGKVVKVIPKLGIIKNIIITPKIMISFLIFIFLLNLSLSYKPNKEEKKDDWF